MKQVLFIYLFGMKYPASRMIGGSMKRKKTFGVSVEGGCSDVRNRRNPMMIPTTMRRHDSGKMWCSFGVMWNPANIKRVNSFSLSFHRRHKQKLELKSLAQ